jgi:hypothetical protein
MSRRAADKIEQILRDFVPLADVDALHARMAREVRARCRRLPDQFVASRPPGPAGEDPEVIRRVLQRLIHEASSEISAGLEDEDGPVMKLEKQQDAAWARVPVVTRSTSLAAARAQLAKLQVEYMQLKARLGRLPVGWPSGHTNHGRTGARP